jgi:hypothetical protein
MGCGASSVAPVASAHKPVLRGVNPSDMSEWLGMLQVKGLENCEGGLFVANYERTVVEAQGLLGLDLGGKSDPFVIISYGPSTFRTNIVPNNCNPVWNQVSRVEAGSFFSFFVV